jgi:serine protease AprX
MIGAEEKHVSHLTGKDVTICILDSGIAPHPDFGRRLLTFRDFIRDKTEPYDDYGHGTHIAGICGGNGMASGRKYRGIAPECNLVIGKILDHRGSGSIEDLVAGIKWCMAIQKTFAIRVLNISAGMNQIPENPKLMLLQQTIEEASHCGMVILCAAGNNGFGHHSITIPGSLPGTITVGSVQKVRQGIRISSFSSREPVGTGNPKPEIYAPGNQIISCCHQGGYIRKTGTSMSVPMVAAALSLLWQQSPHLQAEEISRRLQVSADAVAERLPGQIPMLYLPALLEPKN